MMKRYFLPLLTTGFLILSACSCSNDAVIQQILGTSVEAPVFIDCRPVSSEEIVFEFSAPVKVVSLNFDPPIETNLVEDGQEVSISLSRPLEAGAKITADILVEDSGRNTLNVIVPFRARNDRMPALALNEIRTEYNKPRLEFIELLALEQGNLGAMRLFIAENSLTKPVYEFPPAEVKAGEYIVLHLRTVEEGCVDETGPELNVSPGYEARNDARDFWIPGSSKLIRKDAAIWLMDQDDRIIDAVLLYDKPKDWDKYASAGAEFLGRKKAWLPPDGTEPGSSWIPGPADAVPSTLTSATRTICRDQTMLPSPMAGNWYVTVNSGNSAGEKNNPKRYNP